VSVKLIQLQNALCNLDIERAQFLNFWPKSDHNHNPNPDSKPDLDSWPRPKLNPNQTLIAERIVQTAQTHRSRATYIHSRRKRRQKQLLQQEAYPAICPCWRPKLGHTWGYPTKK